MFALTNVLHLSSKQDDFKRAVALTVRKQLAHFDPGLAPPSEDAPHRLQASHLIHALVIDRSVRHEFSNPLSNASQDDIVKKGMQLFSALTGPWQHKRIRHDCGGCPDCPCGKTLEGARGYVIELLFWLFFELMGDRPALGRWVGLGPCCSWLGACLVIHDVFRQAWLLAFSKHYGGRAQAGADIDDAALGNEHFTAIVGRRVKKVNDFVVDDSRCSKVLALALVSKPVDDLTLNLLRLDSMGRILCDLTSKSMNPVQTAQRAFVRELASKQVANAVSSFFPLTEDKQRDHMSVVRTMLVQLGAAVSFRLGMYFDDFPFKLLHCIHPDRGPEEKHAAADHFYDTPRCCLDPFFSARLRDLFETAFDFASDLNVRKVLQAWMNRGKVTTGHIERGHGRDRVSFESTRRTRRHVEPAIYHSHCRGLMHWHVKLGGRNYTLEQHTSHFASARFGLRLDKFNKRRIVRDASGKARRVSVRPDERCKRPRGNDAGSDRVRFVNDQSRVAKRLRGGKRQPRASETRQRQQWGKDWDDMGGDARERWSSIHPSARLLNDVPSDAPPTQRVPDDILDILEGGDAGPGDHGQTSAWQHSRALAPLVIGDDTWPVDVGGFESHLAARAAEFGFTEWRGGIQAVGEACRPALRNAMCVDCDPALNPVLVVPVACREKHPGLCCTRDADIYDETLALADEMHRHMHGLAAGTYVGFHATVYSNIFCLGVARLRDPAVCILTEVGIDTDTEPHRLFFDIDVEAETFRFLTSYSIARELITAFRTVKDDVMMTVFDVTSLRDNPCDVE
ncbi:unnamed protein product, partial [Prorocentrum cordatum]